MKEQSLSIIIPVYNEEDNVLPLHQKITEALDSLSGGAGITKINITVA